MVEPFGRLHIPDYVSYNIISNQVTIMYWDQAPTSPIPYEKYLESNNYIGVTSIC